MSSQSFKNLSFLLKVEWWQKSLAVAASYAKSFFLPAALLGCANVTSFVATQQMYAILRAQDLRADELPKAVLSACAWMFIGLALISWSLGLLLIRLTAFTRAYLEEGSGPPDGNLWKRCLNEVKHRKLYLFKLWSLASVYLIAPIFPFGILSSIKAASTPMFGAASVISLPPWGSALVNIGLILIAAVITGYSFVVLALSARRLNAAGESAWLSAKLFYREALLLTILSAVILAANTLISTPFALFSVGSVEEMLNQNLYCYIGWQAWFALSSSVLWPWSVIVICDPLRKEF